MLETANDLTVARTISGNKLCIMQVKLNLHILGASVNRSKGCPRKKGSKETLIETLDNGHYTWCPRKKRQVETSSYIFHSFGIEREYGILRSWYTVS